MDRVLCILVRGIDVCETGILVYGLHRREAIDSSRDKSQCTRMSRETTRVKVQTGTHLR